MFGQNGADLIFEKFKLRRIVSQNGFAQDGQAEKHFD
jgi:hypothetical protein